MRSLSPKLFQNIVSVHDTELGL